jgi:hypothetical protein
VVVEIVGGSWVGGGVNGVTGWFTVCAKTVAVLEASLVSPL